MMLRVSAAVILIVGAGLVHGAWTERWRPSREVASLAARFESVPLAVGDWNGTPFELPAEDRSSRGRRWLASPGGTRTRFVGFP